MSIRKFKCLEFIKEFHIRTRLQSIRSSLHNTRSHSCPHQKLKCSKQKKFQNQTYHSGFGNRGVITIMTSLYISKFKGVQCLVKIFTKVSELERVNTNKQINTQNWYKIQIAFMSKTKICKQSNKICIKERWKLVFKSANKIAALKFWRFGGYSLFSSVVRVAEISLLL